MPVNAGFPLAVSPIVCKCVAFFFGMPDDMPYDALSYTPWHVIIVVSVLRHNV
jgi:hypothetical protein